MDPLPFGRSSFPDLRCMVLLPAKGAPAAPAQTRINLAQSHRLEALTLQPALQTSQDTKRTVSPGISTARAGGCCSHAALHRMSHQTPQLAPLYTEILGICVTGQRGVTKPGQSSMLSSPADTGPSIKSPAMHSMPMLKTPAQPYLVPGVVVVCCLVHLHVAIHHLRRCQRRIICQHLLVIWLLRPVELIGACSQCLGGNSEQVCLRGDGIG